MAYYRVPLSKPSPDAQAFIRCIMGDQIPDRPPMVEYLVDPVLMQPIVTNLIGREWVTPQPQDRPSQEAYWDNFIEFWYRMGYDFVRFELGLAFPERRIITDDTAPASTGKRAWADEHQGSIMTWDDFESYPWPRVQDADFAMHEYISAHLPDGMGILTCHGGGIFEHLSWIMSYEGLCIALYDNPELVEAVSSRIGELMVEYYRRLVQFDGVIALFQGDDMGFKSQTLIAPDDLRKFVLPCHKRLAQVAHEAGIPYFLHSCGNVEAVMEDLIEDVEIDAKHSFEDVIIPIAQFQEHYGDRIGVLGGVDVNRLTMDPPEKLRRYVRSVINACAPRGRFAVGSGNSIPSYIPLQNYLTMLDEALR